MPEGGDFKQFRREVLHEALGLFSDRRVAAASVVLGGFGVTATPLFKVNPWWIGPVVLVLLAVALLARGAYLAWLKEHAQNVAHQLEIGDQWRELAVGGLYGIMLQAGNLLIESPWL